jgi:D-inositol-3-phosphate glycosyltransferase
VIGSGDSRWLEAVAERSGVSELVRPLGRREDVERFYQAADVFILPSAYETFSLVAHEAAASGLPVLATRVSGVAELIDAGGAVETRRDARAIADALCRLAGSAESRAEIGDAGRLFVSQLTWARSADSVFEVYESAFAARSL